MKAAGRVERGAARLWMSQSVRTGRVRRGEKGFRIATRPTLAGWCSGVRRRIARESGGAGGPYDGACDGGGAAVQGAGAAPQTGQKLRIAVVTAKSRLH